MKNLLIIFVFFLVTYQTNAQNLKNIIIDESANGKRLNAYLMEVEQLNNIDFLFEADVVDALTISGVSGKMYLSSYLDIFLEPYKLKVIRSSDNIYFIISEALWWEYGKNKENYVVFKIEKARKQLLNGVIKDIDSGEPIIGAQVINTKTGNGVLTDKNGYFEMHVPMAIYQIEVRFIGYETSSFVTAFSSHGEIEQANIRILQAPMELAGVTITAEGRDKNIRAIVPGVEKLGIEAIKKLPTFLGVVDPVKSLTTLPGVSTVGELSAGFNVRGGETGQNLIIQDGAIIYNPSHLFGFFSAFNPDFVQDVALYKGGGPARFGGRVSSTLDIKLRNGDASKFTVTGGAGLVSSRLAIEGPIVKNKSSFLLGGRISYTNWLLKATDNIQLVNSSAQFYDLTAKTFHRINENNFLSITGYRSYDDFSLTSDSTFSWGTTNASIKWDHAFNDDLLSTLSFSSSNYFSEILNDSEIEAFLYRNSINNLWLKYDVNYKKNEAVNINFGLDINRTFLEPGQLNPLMAESNVLPIDISDQHVIEPAVYVQGDFDLSDRWAIAAGLRYSHFYRLGKDRIYTFDYDNFNGRYPGIADSINYAEGEVISEYGGFGPRVSLRYLIDESTSLKGSYYRTYQYLHLISNTTSVTPQDYWVASGPYLKPQIGDQLSLGYFKNFVNNTYEFSIEGFYKETANAVDYIEGADITLNKALEAGLVSGEGLSYGVELLARKNTGKLNGWISYTYSRSLKRFKSESQFESISNGEYYPSSYDQPHNLSVIANFSFNPRIILSANFSYKTGRPITIPVSKFSYDSYLAVLNYSERNEYRIPDYHRLDISLTIKDRQRKNSSFRGEWVFSIFNVYSRDNAYSIFFNKFGTAKKMSILGSAFPSISYNFTF